jgi:hypothetical protein
MTKTPQELADYLKNYNRWRRGSYLHEQPVPEELGKVLDQVIAILEDLPRRVLSECCGAQAVVAGKPNSTQWHVCPECCQPCDVFIRTTTTQQPQ